LLAFFADQIFGADVAVDDVVGNDLPRLVGVDVDVGDGVLARDVHFDNGLERAHAHAARARHFDVPELTGRDVVHKGVEDGSGARRNAAGRHADDDAGLLLRVLVVAQIDLPFHLVADSLDVGYALHKFSPPIA